MRVLVSFTSPVESGLLTQIALKLQVFAFMNFVPTKVVTIVFASVLTVNTNDIIIVVTNN
jgi:hypothetical protein